MDCPPLRDGGRSSAPRHRGATTTAAGTSDRGGTHHAQTGTHFPSHGAAVVEGAVAVKFIAYRTAELAMLLDAAEEPPREIRAIVGHSEIDVPANVETLGWQPVTREIARRLPKDSRPPCFSWLHHPVACARCDYERICKHEMVHAPGRFVLDTVCKYRRS